MTAPEDNDDHLTLKFRALESQICILKKDIRITYTELQEVGTVVPRAAVSSSDPPNTVSTTGNIELVAVSVEHPLNGNTTVETPAAPVYDGSVTPEYHASSSSESSSEEDSSTKADASPKLNWESDIEMPFSVQADYEEIIDSMPFEDIRNMILDIDTLSVEERQEITRLVELYEPANVVSVSNQNQIRFWYLSTLTLREVEKYVSSKLGRSRKS